MNDEMLDMLIDEILNDLGVEHLEWAEELARTLIERGWVKPELIRND